MKLNFIIRVFGYKPKYIFGSFVSSVMILFIILNLFGNKNSEVINIQPKMKTTF